MPHTNEEIKKRFNQHQEDNDYALGCSCEECENFIISFINQELSDLKKSIREEIAGKKKEYRDFPNGYNSKEEIEFNEALDEILSLDSLK